MHRVRKEAAQCRLRSFSGIIATWMAGPSPAMRGQEACSTNFRGDDLVGIAHRLAALDLVDILHAGRDLAPNRILLIEKACIGEADEELRIRRIRALRPRHRNGAAGMRLGI